MCHSVLQQVPQQPTLLQREAHKTNLPACSTVAAVTATVLQLGVHLPPACCAAGAAAGAARSLRQLARGQPSPDYSTHDLTGSDGVDGSSHTMPAATCRTGQLLGHEPWPLFGSGKRGPPVAGAVCNCCCCCCFHRHQLDALAACCFFWSFISCSATPSDSKQGHTSVSCDHGARCITSVCGVETYVCGSACPAFMCGPTVPN
jgi:hypothetical protein